MPSRPAFFITIDRPAHIQVARLELPILAEEQVIMETIQANHVTIICGETGSGKTTQVPQFLFEAGYSHPASPHPGLIGVTEPRRVAAISMSERVATELALPRDVCSYQIRYEGTVSPRTRLKFVTDGVLLREIADDFLLSRYSVLIIDEAHERSVNTDIVLGLLSRIVPLRAKKFAASQPPGAISPLKLIIMSATLRIEDFVGNRSLFPLAPPVCRVDARQFPVTVHFNRRTPAEYEYMTEAYRKVCKLHTRLPPGSVLVFVTSKQEVLDLCRKLRRKFPASLDRAALGMDSNQLTKPSEKRRTKSAATASTRGSADPRESEELSADAESTSLLARFPIVVDRQTGSRRVSMAPSSALADEDLVPTLSDDEDGDASNSDAQSVDLDAVDERAEASSTFGDEDEAAQRLLDDADDDQPDFSAPPLLVLPLYAMLSRAEQMRVFEPAPEGVRVCIVATNVAETSLTIPGVRYVVDTGKVKTKLYDHRTGMSQFAVGWTSKASADQRAGRAGRTGPGHCYRLYSSAVFTDAFAAFSDPEILRMPIDGLVLQMKGMGIDHVVNFPFPTAPSREALKEAERMLVTLGALDVTTLRPTPLGRLMSRLPVSPRLAKMLAVSRSQNGLLPYTLALVSGMSVGELFASPVELGGKSALDVVLADSDDDENPADNTSSGGGDREARHEREQRRKLQEMIRLAVDQWRDDDGDCMSMLRAVGAFEYASGDEAFCQRHGLRYKSLVEVRKLRGQLARLMGALSGPGEPGLSLLDARLPPAPPHMRGLLKQVLLCGFADRLARRKTAVRGHSGHRRRTEYETLSTQEPVFIHPMSFLARIEPEWLVFEELVVSKRVYMRGCTPIDPDVIPTLVPQMCRFSKPLEQPSPYYDSERDDVRCFVTATIAGPQNWALPASEQSFPLGPDRFRWFARFLLDGEVLPEMSAMSAYWVSKPVNLVKPWSQVCVLLSFRAARLC
jgi:ATP-dependent RNA helicase DHX37/DHR1